MVGSACGVGNRVVGIAFLLALGGDWNSTKWRALQCGRVDNRRCDVGTFRRIVRVGCLRRLEPTPPIPKAVGDVSNRPVTPAGRPSFQGSARNALESRPTKREFENVKPYCDVGVVGTTFVA